MVRTIALSPVKGSLLALSGGDDRIVAVWDARPEPPARPSSPGTAAPVRCVAFSADGRLAVFGSGDPGRKADCSVRLWDLRTGPTDRSAGSPRQLDYWRRVCRTDGQLLGWCSKDGTASLWDRAAQRAKRCHLIGHDAKRRPTASPSRWTPGERP